MPTPIETPRGRLNTAESASHYLMADADRPAKRWTTKIVTLRSAKTGQHYTYKVTRPPGDGSARPWLVYVLNGPNNREDYIYLGLLTPEADWKHTAKSSVPVTAPAFLAFDFLAHAVLQQGRMPTTLEVFHEGKCGRCGRKLTTPESVARGIGPECASVLHR